MVRLTDRPDTTLDVNRGRKTIIQHYFTGLEKTALSGSKLCRPCIVSDGDFSVPLQMCVTT